MNTTTPTPAPNFENTYVNSELEKANRIFRSWFPLRHRISFRRYAGIYCINPEAFCSNTEALLNLAWCCYKGKGCFKNGKMAFDLYAIAAKASSATAMRMLGNCYFYGIGVEKNYNLAFNNYMNAVCNGDKISELYAGMCYDYGMGTAQDYNEAAKHYQEAAKLHYIEAIRRLADYSYNGICGTPDYEKAVELYKKILMYNLPEVLRNLSLCYKNGTGVKKSKMKHIWYKAKAAFMEWSDPLPLTSKIPQ